MNKNTKGFIPVMLTPFTTDGKVDFNALTQLTEFYLRAGASGLFANCLSSEMFELTEGERVAVTRHVVRVAAGAVPVVATATFGGDIAAQADLTKRIYDTGIDAAIAITNMLAAADDPDARFEERVYQLLDQTGSIPFGFYECPEPFKRVLSARQLGEFVATGRVIYHKDTCLDIKLVRAKLAAASGASAFGLYDAYMVHAVESLKAGAAGLSCIQGNYYPELVVWLCHHYDDEASASQVAQVQRFFDDHMDVMHGVYPTVAKYFLQKRGLAIATFTRRDVGVFDKRVKDRLDALDAAYQLLFRESGIRLELNS